MTMSWRTSAGRLRDARPVGSVMSRPPRPAGQSAPGAVDAAAAGPGRRQVRLTFSALMPGMLLAALDQTIVTTALPTITGDLHGLNHIGYVVTACLLAGCPATGQGTPAGRPTGRRGHHPRRAVPGRRIPPQAAAGLSASDRPGPAAGLAAARIHSPETSPGG
jgi:hypothetical protein